MEITDDLRIQFIDPLGPPVLLLKEFPLNEEAASLVAGTRREIERILFHDDDRLLVVVGPCSIHDPDAALEYGEKLRAEADRHRDTLLLVMRVYFEKPRTTIGWKGLINDPDCDGSFQINKGLRIARKLLLDLAARGVAAGTEWLDTISPQYLADVVAWGAIGARTTESQLHRQLASGLSMPVGFKNGTGGSVQMAIDAIHAARHPHHFLGATNQGLTAIVATNGNPDCHVILRGSSQGPNHDEASVQATMDALRKAGLPETIMIDCSHGNSAKDFRRQPVVAEEIARQIAAGNRAINGVMIESHLVEGAQSLTPDRSKLVYGQSVTDACIGWEDTTRVFDTLANAVKARRSLKKFPVTS
jgi:3-deoxy-7-phosphoheptulonate synthase